MTTYEFEYDHYDNVRSNSPMVLWSIVMAVLFLMSAFFQLNSLSGSTSPTLMNKIFTITYGVIALGILLFYNLPAVGRRRMFIFLKDGVLTYKTKLFGNTQTVDLRKVRSIKLVGTNYTFVTEDGKTESLFLSDLNMESRIPEFRAAIDCHATNKA